MIITITIIIIIIMVVIVVVMVIVITVIIVIIVIITVFIFLIFLIIIIIIIIKVSREAVGFIVVSSLYGKFSDDFKAESARVISRRLMLCVPFNCRGFCCGWYGGYNSALRRGNMFDGRTTLCGRCGKCCCCSLRAAGCRCLTLHVAAPKEIGNSLIHQLHAALCARTLLTRLVALPSQ